MIMGGLEISKNPVFERLDFERVGYSASNTHCEIRNLLTGYRDHIRISSSKLKSEKSPALDLKTKPEDYRTEREFRII